jgi:hypothetical protein
LPHSLASATYSGHDGLPAQRQRKAGIVDPVTGKLVPFPYMPRVAELPPGWRWFSTAEKVEHLLGMSLDRAAEVLTWPLAELDPLQLSLRMQVWRVVFMFGVRAMLDGTLAREADRERDRQRILAEFARDLRPADSRP